MRDTLGGTAYSARTLQQLTSGEQFRAVLAKGSRRSSGNFLIRAIPNGLTLPRLGIIASRKIAKRAVDRNRGKRVVRELFRLRREQIKPFDIVVQLRTDLRKSNGVSLRSELGMLLEQLTKAGATRTMETP